MKTPNLDREIETYEIHKKQGYLTKDGENYLAEFKAIKQALIKSDDISRSITPVRIRVKLRQEQYTGVMNKWICTIHGEVREVTMREVEWYCANVEDAVHSFKESEIESFSIVGQY